MTDTARMIPRIGLIFSLLFISWNLKAQYVSLNQQEIHQLKRLSENNNTVAHLINRFRQQADQALNEKPQPIEKIRSEGLLMGDPLKIASLKAVQDADKIYALALMYRLDSVSTYRHRVITFLKAWAEVNQASGNPIDETKLEPAIIGYDLLRSGLGKSDREQIDHWFKSIADAEIHSSYARPGRGTAINNWNAHRIKIITMIDFTLHNHADDKFIKQQLADHLAINLYPDGTSLDFKERDALHYHIYDLESLLQTAIILKRATGTDYFHMASYTGSSIKKSVDFLVPFVTGEKKHTEFVNSKAAFDRARAANQEKGYQQVDFIPSTGIYVLTLAAYFDPVYALAVQHGASGSQLLNWQMILNKIRK